MKTVFVEQAYVIPESRSAYFRVPDDWDEAKIEELADYLLDEAGESFDTGYDPGPEYVIDEEDEPDSEDTVFTVNVVGDQIQVVEETKEPSLKVVREGGAE